MVRPAMRLAVLLVSVAVMLLGGAPRTWALAPTCLPGGFPATPTPPVISVTGYYFDESFYVDVWRVPCQDASGEVAVLLRVTPITPSPWVCSINFDFVQGGEHIDGRLLLPGSDAGFCGDVSEATTFSHERVLGPPLDNKAAFTVVIDPVTASRQPIQLEVPAYASQLGMAVVSTGCGPCSAGQLAQFHLRVENPGPPVTVELKTGIRLPGGAAVTLLGLHVEETLGSGAVDLPLAGIIVPAEVPTGTYTVEAALLDPIFGTTLARHSLNVVKQ
jgi:hypothetical protein